MCSHSLFVRRVHSFELNTRTGADSKHSLNLHTALSFISSPPKLYCVLRSPGLDVCVSGSDEIRIAPFLRVEIMNGNHTSYRINGIFFWRRADVSGDIRA